MSAENLNITLRRTTAADAEFITELRNQASSLRFQASPMRSVDETRSTLAEQSDLEIGPATAAKLSWVIEVDGLNAGAVQLDLSGWNRAQQFATLGYTVAESFQGKGVATAAVRLVKRIAFGPGGLGLGRVEAVAAVENVGSHRVLEKAGFQFEGVRRGLLLIRGERIDHRCYGLLSTDSWED